MHQKLYKDVMACVFVPLPSCLEISNSSVAIFSRSAGMLPKIACGKKLAMLRETHSWITNAMHPHAKFSGGSL